MKKRSKAASKPAKARPRKALKRKGPSAPKSSLGRGSAAAGKTKVAKLTDELNEAREQQAATSRVLQLISSSAGELDPVFQAILANATRICEAKHGYLYLFADGVFQFVASHGTSAAALERLRALPMQPAPGTGLGRMLKTKAAIQIADVLTDQAYPRDHPQWRIVERESVRTLLCVPMMKEEALIGAISIYRQEVRQFTDTQIELVILRTRGS
jgi:GAF domain-containing protein